MGPLLHQRYNFRSCVAKVRPKCAIACGEWCSCQRINTIAGLLTKKSAPVDKLTRKTFITKKFGSSLWTKTDYWPLCNVRGVRINLTSFLKGLWVFVTKCDKGDGVNAQGRGVQRFAIASRITFIYMKYGRLLVRVIFMRYV